MKSKSKIKNKQTKNNGELKNSGELLRTSKSLSQKDINHSKLDLLRFAKFFFSLTICSHHLRLRKLKILKMKNLRYPAQGKGLCPV